MNRGELLLIALALTLVVTAWAGLAWTLQAVGR